jgi:phosphonopyruvate decarboxylase
MGGLATIATLAPRNYKHLVLNNGAHDSVGGQPTVGHLIDLRAVARACGYRFAERVDTAEALPDALTALAASEGPALLEVRMKKGARADLGRPKMKPVELKRIFMEYVAG